MASAPASDTETTTTNTGYWSGYVRRMRGDSSGGGAAAPAAPGRLDPPPTTVLSPPPTKGAARGGLGASGRHAPSPENASSALASAKSAPLRESSGKGSDVYGRPEWDPLFTSTSSFRGRASVSPRPGPGAAAGEHGRARPGSASLAATARAAARAASPGPRPGTAGQRAAARPATQRDRRYSAGHDDCGGGGSGSVGNSPAVGVRSHTHNPRELAALAGIYRQQAARAGSPGPTARPGAAHASPGRGGGRYGSPGPGARYSSPASPPPRGRCSSPTPGRQHARGAAAAAVAPAALSDPGVDVLFAECTSKLQHLEYSALLLLMAAREAKGRLPEDGEAPVDLPEAEFDREAAKEAWDALKRHQAAAAQRWSLQRSRGGVGSGGGSSAATSGGGGGGPSAGGSSAAEGSDGGSTRSAAGLLRQRYIASES